MIISSRNKYPKAPPPAGLFLLITVLKLIPEKFRI
jgi:hypothetical protein